MAIIWGNPVGTSNQLRLGIEYRVTSNTDTAQWVMIDSYIWTQYGQYDSNNTFVRSGTHGSYSGAVSFNFPSSSSWSTNNIKLINSVGKSIPKAIGKTTAVTNSISLTGVEAVGYSTKAVASATYYVPARAVAIPTAPTNVAHTRDSDKQNTVTWTHNGSSNAPYEGVAVERSENGGAWVERAVAGRIATSYVDTACNADSYYSYRVRALNDAGYSGYSNTSALTWNTPIRPSSAQAELQSETKVAITWTSASKTANKWEISRRAGTGAFELIGSSETLSYTDSTAPPGTVTYSVRAVSERSNGVLKSVDETLTNSIKTIQPPLAPTLKALKNVTAVEDSVLNLEWTHNSVDGSPETNHEVKVLIDGVEQQADYASSMGQADIILQPAWAGSRVEFHVRTWGLHQDPSPWAVASTSVYFAPSVSISEPASNGAVITGAPLAIAWSANLAHGSQTEYALSVHEASSEALVYSKSASGDASTLEVPIEDFLPRDKTGYEIRLTITESTTLQASTRRSFYVDYLAPATPSVFAGADQESGSVSITVYEGEEADVPATSYLSVFRECPQGSCLIATKLPTGSTVIDSTAPLGRAVTYKVVAHAASGAIAEETQDITIRSDGFMVNFGSGFQDVAHAKYNISYSESAGHESKTQAFIGRALPALLASVQRSRTITINHSIAGEVDLRAWEALAEYTGVVILRTPTGKRYPARATIAIDYGSGGAPKVSATFEQVDEHD